MRNLEATTQAYYTTADPEKVVKLTPHGREVLCGYFEDTLQTLTARGAQGVDETRTFLYSQLGPDDTAVLTRGVWERVMAPHMTAEEPPLIVQEITPQPSKVLYSF